MMNNDENFLQVELWRECDQKCRFCYIGEVNGFQTEQLKLDSIRQTRDIIQRKEHWEKHNGFALIGGEFFQGQLSTPTLEREFAKLMDDVVQLLTTNVIKGFWITASLTKPISQFFIETLEKFTPFENIWVCTSYDTIGRFHIESQKKTWEQNMAFLKQSFPHINLNTTMIITQALTELYKEQKDFFKSFVEKHNTQLALKCPDVGYTDKSVEAFIQRTGLKNFFPERKSFIEFLQCFIRQEGYNPFGKTNRAEELYEEFEDGHYKTYKERTVEKFSEEDDFNACGHSKYFCRYIDSDKCMMCDRDKILKELDNE